VVFSPGVILVLAAINAVQVLLIAFLFALLAGRIVLAIRRGIQRGRDERHDYVPDVVGPGESVVGRFPASLFFDENARWGDVVVTDRFLRVVIKPGARRPMANIAIPLGRITSLGVSPQEENITQVSVSGEGGAEFFLHPRAAKELQRILEAAMNRPLTTNVADELARLSQLMKDGVISSDEWDRAKTLYLGQPRNKRDESVRILRELASLRQSGVLSESEFNSKKWDVLARLN
jgi:hypothetical protein